MLNVGSSVYKSMIKLNFSNVEELVFYDKKAQGMLPPSYFSIFEQWRIAKRMPMLKSIGKQAVLDLLNTLTESDIVSLETYFQESVFLEKLNYSITRNLKVPLAETKDICNSLCDITDVNYFSTWRDDEYLYISFWR